MKISYLLSLVLGVGSVNLIAPAQSLSSTSVAQLENITNITTSVLDKLGYDCQTASAAAIICRKCSEQSSISEKCTAYICDSVTKKCRQKKATVPKLPNSNNEGESENSEPLSIPDL